METFFKLIKDGGFTMIPIIFCSLLSLTIIIERALALRYGRIIPRKLVTLVAQFSKDQTSQIMEYCTKHITPFSSLVKKVIVNSNLPNAEVVELIKVSGRQETKGLDRGLFLLELIAGIAPLLGLLGTVLGMLDIFKVISKVGIGQAQALSSGISKALITTIAGLIVAIPTLTAHSVLVRKVDGVIDEIDRLITNLYGKLYGIRIE